MHVYGVIEHWIMWQTYKHFTSNIFIWGTPLNICSLLHIICCISDKFSRKIIENMAIVQIQNDHKIDIDSYKIGLEKIWTGFGFRFNIRWKHYSWWYVQDARETVISVYRKLDTFVSWSKMHTIQKHSTNENPN